MNELVIDYQKTYETPEGAYLKLPLAGIAVRGRALFVDFFIRGIVYFGIMKFFSEMGGFGAGMILIALFLIEWGYPILFEIFWQGQTPGKKIFRIAVVHDDGSPISWRASVMRNTMRFVDAFPVGYIPGVITMLLNQDFKRMGDILAETVVIYLPLPENRRKIKANIKRSKLQPVAPAIALTADQEAALVEFWYAKDMIRPARADEIAMGVKALVGDRVGREATTYLYQLAIYLIHQKAAVERKPSD